MCIPDVARRGRGFTLPELLLLIIVLAIALVGIVLVINTATAEHRAALKFRVIGRSTYLALRWVLPIG